VTRKLRDHAVRVADPEIRRVAGDRLLMLSPDALQPYPRNARTHSKKQIGQIAESIRRFGFTNPVLIDDANMIAQDPWEVSAVRQYQALLRQNLNAFTERCFYELSPSQTYLHNWHLEALAYHLGEVVAGRCQRLLITLPPRSLGRCSLPSPSRPLCSDMTLPEG
jgi:hypothetical protein